MQLMPYQQWVTAVGSRGTERKKMSMLRRKVAQRLVAVKNETAMLTTFQRSKHATNF